jgi:serine/threonine protein kinase
LLTFLFEFSSGYDNDLKCKPVQIENLNKKEDWIKIGSGQFGQVFKGIYYLDNNELALNVAIKEIKNNLINDTNDKNDLIKEANILSDCNHINIVKMYGVCYENDEIPKYIIMEYMNNGDLRSYLIKNKSTKVINLK